MKEVKSRKKNPMYKIFIKICRIFGFEIIDQSNFSFPASNKSLSDTISIPGKNSVTLPLGKVEITRPVKSLNIILRTCMSVNMLTQSKERMFEKDKDEYTKRTLISIVKSTKKCFATFSMKKCSERRSIICRRLGTPISAPFVQDVDPVSKCSNRNRYS